MDTLVSIFEITNNVLGLALSDLTDDTARRRTRGDEGPSIAWTIGHLLDHRMKVLQLLGDDRDSPYAADFTETPATDGVDYPSIDELGEHWARVHAELMGAFETASADTLDRPLPDGGAHGESRVRDKLAFYAWHEGYHTGVIGAARKASGLPGPAELAAAASRS